jgi:four helix bundle protein
MDRRDLEDRLINFAVLIVKIAESMPPTRAGGHLSGQLLRSGTSPALNYAEAQGGESRRDFIHKIKIVLKELRETFACLKIIHRTKLFGNDDVLQDALKESNELISIFVKSCSTAQSHLERKAPTT